MASGCRLSSTRCSHDLDPLAHRLDHCVAGLGENGAGVGLVTGTGCACPQRVHEDGLEGSGEIYFRDTGGDGLDKGLVVDA